MIQRIQTLYLFIIVVLSLFSMFLPFGGFINTTEALHYIINYKGIFLIQASGNEFLQNVWSLTALSAIIPVLAFITIFLFKKRMLQIRLVIFNMVLMVGYYVLLGIYFWQATTKLNADWYLEIVTAFPLINLILSYLALRAIGKDEALIKSLNRLR